MTACKRCGGPKPIGVRGGKYCDPCRLLAAAAFEQHEYERGRRRAVGRVEDKLATGKRIKARTLDVPDGHKWCARCQQFVVLTSFPPRKESGRSAAAYCIPCQRSYNRERLIRLKFGLTWEEYDLLLADQEGRCAICGGLPRKHVLSVDHNHKTGEIRGLLCSRCNHRLLGSANDSAERLRKAADYLEAFNPRDVFGEPKYVPGSKGAA